MCQAGQACITMNGELGKGGRRTVREEVCGKRPRQGEGEIRRRGPPPLQDEGPAAILRATVRLASLLPALRTLLKGLQKRCI